MNLVLWSEGSSGAVPFSTLVALLALWFGVSVPLTFIGAYFGFCKRVHFISSVYCTDNYFTKLTVDCIAVVVDIVVFSRLWSIRCAPIKYLVRYRINRFILSPYPASLWAVSCPLAASSSSFSSFSARYGPAKCIICSVSCFWYSLSWSSPVPRRLSCSVTSICVPKTITGGGDPSSPRASLQSTCSSTVVIILPLSCPSRMQHPRSFISVTQLLWFSCSSCWRAVLASLPASGSSGRSTVWSKWIRWTPFYATDYASVILVSLGPLVTRSSVLYFVT